MRSGDFDGHEFGEVMDLSRLRPVVERDVRLLVDGNYEALVRLTAGIRMDAVTIRRAIEGYGRDLIPFPDEGFNELDVIEVESTKPRRWSVRCPLRTRQEGRSDLTLELTIIREATGFKVELDDIHVL